MDELMTTLITISPNDRSVRFASLRQFIIFEGNRMSGIANGIANRAMSMDVEGFKGITGVFAKIIPVR